MTPRELLTIQAAFAHINCDPVMQQKLFGALRDAVFAMEMSGTSPAPAQAPSRDVLDHEFRKGFIEGQIDMREQIDPSSAVKAMTDAQIEKLREATFSTNNPFCPVDSKSMRKAIRAYEAKQCIGVAASTTQPPATKGVES
ncbi:MAG: hypothetical protein EOP24_26100 [Hyphomicrobiales bacterium]|nr:MAG: hypothetical protein EOP24_26100 [Hyphomicrobiales bacterium]